MNVLIVDDIALNRKLLRVNLESHGFKTFETGNGMEALGLLEHEKIDLIITDMLMPGMNGYQLCEEVRKSPAFRNIPLILFTAMYTPTTGNKLCLECGADKYLEKPVPTEVLLREIQNAIEYRKQHPQLLEDLKQNEGK